MDRTNPSKYMKRSERLILPSEETNALTSTDSGTEELSKMAKKDEREEEDSKKPQEHEKYACPYTFNDFVEPSSVSTSHGIESEKNTIFFVPCLLPRLPPGECASKDNPKKLAAIVLLDSLPFNFFDELSLRLLLTFPYLERTNIGKTPLGEECYDSEVSDVPNELDIDSDGNGEKRRKKKELDEITEANAVTFSEVVITNSNNSSSSNPRSRSRSKSRSSKATSPKFVRKADDEKKREEEKARMLMLTASYLAAEEKSSLAASFTDDDVERVTIIPNPANPTESNEMATASTNAVDTNAWDEGLDLDDFMNSLQEQLLSQPQPKPSKGEGQQDPPAEYQFPERPSRAKPRRISGVQLKSAIQQKQKSTHQNLADSRSSDTERKALPERDSQKQLEVAGIKAPQPKPTIKEPVSREARPRFEPRGSHLPFIADLQSPLPKGEEEEEMPLSKEPSLKRRGTHEPEEPIPLPSLSPLSSPTRVIREPEVEKPTPSTLDPQSQPKEPSHEMRRRATPRREIADEPAMKRPNYDKPERSEKPVEQHQNPTPEHLQHIRLQQQLELEQIQQQLLLLQQSELPDFLDPQPHVPSPPPQQNPQQRQQHQQQQHLLWSDGVLFNASDHSLYASLRSDNDNIYLLLTYQGSQESQHKFRSLYHIVMALLRSQFPDINNATYIIDTEKSPKQEITRNLIVPKISVWDFPITYTLEECELETIRGRKTINFPSSSTLTTSNISTIVPSVSLADLAAFRVATTSVKEKEFIAKGAFGQVFKAKFSVGVVNTPIATKDLVFSFGLLGKQTSLVSFKAFREEIWKHSVLSSPYVCQMLGWVMDTNRSPEGTLSILLEYLPDSDLYGLLNSKEVLTWETRLHVAKDIAQGMVYKFHGGNLQPQKFIHESGFVHHDLKSLNVLVNKDEALIKAKIADLGEATMIFAGTKREQVDNPRWLAPEVINGAVFNTKSDVYSFGIILWELAIRQPPFSEYPVARSAWMSDFEDEIVRGLRPSLPPIVFSEYFLEFSTKNGITAEYAALIERSWHQTPERRPTFGEILVILEILFLEMFTKPPVSSLSTLPFLPCFSNLNLSSSPSRFSSSSPSSAQSLSPQSSALQPPSPNSPSPPHKDSKPLAPTHKPNPKFPVTQTAMSTMTPREMCDSNKNGPSPRRSKSRPKILDTISSTLSLPPSSSPSAMSFSTTTTIINTTTTATSISTTTTTQSQSPPNTTTPRTSAIDIVSPRKSASNPKRHFKFSKDDKEKGKSGR